MAITLVCNRWRLVTAACAAVLSGCTVLGVRMSRAPNASLASVPTAASSASDEAAQEQASEDYEEITPENREDIARRVAEQAVQSVASLGIPEDRRREFGSAVEVSIAALLGVPGPMVEYQRRHGAELDGTVMRAWVDQLHVWNMLESVSGGETEALELYTRSVEVPEERFAAIQAMSVQGAETGLAMTIQTGSAEWPYAVLVWKLNVWKPASGYLTDSEGEAIKDGTSGRTVRIAIPARFQQDGEGLLRVNFYWDEGRSYWVPHMVMVGANWGGGKTSPMLLF